MQGGKVSLEPRPDLLQRAEPRICAFDIETTKLPLQFPNAEYDQVRGCEDGRPPAYDAISNACSRGPCTDRKPAPSLSFFCCLNHHLHVGSNATFLVKGVTFLVKKVLLALAGCAVATILLANGITYLQSVDRHA